MKARVGIEAAVVVMEGRTLRGRRRELSARGIIRDILWFLSGCDVM